MYTIYINKRRRQADCFLQLANRPTPAFFFSPSFLFGNSRLTSWWKRSLVPCPHFLYYIQQPLLHQQSVQESKS